MKKLLFSALALASLSFAHGQAYFNTFEESTDLDGWVLHNDNNTVYTNYQAFLNNAWNLVSLNSDPNAPNIALSSTSWFNNAGVADRWAVTPPIDLTDYTNAILDFDIRASDEAPWNDGIILKISTTGTAKADFTTVLYDSTTNGEGEDEEWSSRSIDLSNYSGQVVHFAFINQWEDGNIAQIDNIVVDGNLAVKDLSKSKVSIYPNPVKEEFKINLDRKYNSVKTEIKVSDLAGRTVKTFKAGETYNVSDLGKGVYLVSVTDGINSHTQKIIKK